MGRRDRRWRQVAPPALCAASQLPQLLSYWQADFCAGDAQWIRRQVGAHALPVIDASIDGVTIARLAQDKFLAGDVLAPERAVPDYVRDRVAQTVAERRDADRIPQP